MQRILVANRGEIACRIIRAAKALGLQTVAVYSDADANSLHCSLADVAVHVGPSPASQSYLNVDAILAAGQAHGADGVHPGYGFLSENTVFAQAAEAAGMRWIGPSVASIENMGDKNRAREIAASCGVPVLPGSRRFLPGDLADLETAAERVGYPLLVKAAGGGGGIGMKRVDGPQALAETVATTQTLAQKAFNDGSVYLERYVARARHIEIQVFGYGDGTAVHLYERECSMQRRFQKIVEESPAPGLRADVLAKMSESAVALAGAQRYRGAGTVEFILDADSGEFFFLEMNTRIQVEHGVTELVTGWDLVQAQIQLAAGTLVPVAQSSIQRLGAAIECRLYAENPAKNFMPSPGTLKAFRIASQDGLRVDTGVREGDTISPYYDPMIAKLLTVGHDREQARSRMLCALEQTQIDGIKHNVVFLANLLQHPGFIAGQVDTAFVTRELAALNEPKTAEALT